MKITILLLITSVAFISNSALENNIRNVFHHETLTEEKLEQIVENKQYNSSAITKAYQGICETMLAQYAFLPTSKLSYFNDGKAKIEQAIKEAPKNGEVRYARLLVQLNAPSFLGYADNIISDLKIFIDYLSSTTTDKKWLNIFIENLLAAEHISPDQITELSTAKKLLS